MRYVTRQGAQVAEGEMTPMIDMTFQLIAFFMVLINFNEADQNQAVRLPSSELAKPPDGPLESPLYIHLLRERKTPDGRPAPDVIFAGQELFVAGLKRPLDNEKQIINATKGRSLANSTIIIRADKDAETGRVQKVIQICQEVGFEKFALRAKEEKAAG